MNLFTLHETIYFFCFSPFETKQQQAQEKTRKRASLCLSQEDTSYQKQSKDASTWNKTVIESLLRKENVTSVYLRRLLDQMIHYDILFLDPESGCHRIQTETLFFPEDHTESNISVSTNFLQEIQRKYRISRNDSSFIKQENDSEGKKGPSPDFEGESRFSLAFFTCHDYWFLFTFFRLSL